MYSLLERWPSLSPYSALELLDPRYADPRVRLFAVQCLSKISDADMCDLLWQLIQGVKNENNAKSPLGT